MEEVFDDSLTDEVISLLHGVRDGARELRGIEMDAPIRHLAEKRIELPFQTIEGTNDSETAVNTLKHFLEATATCDSENDRISRAAMLSPLATHIDAQCSTIEVDAEGSDGDNGPKKRCLRISVYCRYLEVTEMGPMIDGDLVLHGQTLERGFLPSLCVVDFAADHREEVQYNVTSIMPWQMILSEQEEAADDGGTFEFTIPITLGENFRDGTVTVHLYAGKWSESLLKAFGEDDGLLFTEDGIASMQKELGALGNEQTHVEAIKVSTQARVGSANAPTSEEESRVVTKVYVTTSMEERDSLIEAGFEECLSMDVSSGKGEVVCASPVFCRPKTSDDDSTSLSQAFILTKSETCTAGTSIVTGIGFVERTRGEDGDPANEDGSTSETLDNVDFAAEGKEASLHLKVTTTCVDVHSDIPTYDRLKIFVSFLAPGENEEEEYSKSATAMTEFLAEASVDGVAGALCVLPWGVGMERPGVVALALNPTAQRSGSTGTTADSAAVISGRAFPSEEIKGSSRSHENQSAGDPFIDCVTGEDAAEEVVDEVEGESGDEKDEVDEELVAEQLERKVEDLSKRESELSSANIDLQKKSASFLAREKASTTSASTKRTNAEGVTVDGTGNDDAQSSGDRNAEKESILSSVMIGISSSRLKIARQIADYDQLSHDLQTRLDDREFKAAEIAESFAAFKREILAKAENTRTNRPLSNRDIKQFSKAQATRDEDLERVRLRNISMRSQLIRLEKQLRAREQLAEGLHMIDFEQLKVENQTLYEKIEERTEELTKLKRKKNNTVQILTHVREKLRCIENNNTSLNKLLGNVENETMEKRGALTGSKKDRDVIRDDNKELRRKQGFASSAGLLTDYEQRVKDLGDIKARINELSDKYNMLASQVQRDTELVAAATSSGPLHHGTAFAFAPPSQQVDASIDRSTNQSEDRDTPFFPGALPGPGM